MEYCDGGSMLDIIRATKKPVKEEIISAVCAQVIEVNSNFIENSTPKASICDTFIHSATSIHAHTILISTDMCTHRDLSTFTLTKLFTEISKQAIF
jgi:serine/threonine protein kinase